MATLKTGWVKKIIDGVSTKIFAISHVKSTYYDYTNGKTLKSKLDDMDKSISEKSEKDHTHSYAGSDSVGGAATSAKECTGNSATATKATQDSDGNIIKSTYSKVGHTHTKSEITDFPSSLKNPNKLSINGKTYDGSSATDVGVMGASYGGTGKTSLGDSANVLINALSTGSDTPKDGDYYVSQYVNGGTSTTTYHRRPMSALWNYIKSKLSTVATSGSYNDLSNKPTIGNGTVTIKQAGTSKGSFTMNQSGNTTIELTDNNTTYSTATQSANGLMSSSDKTKLNGIATGANKTTVDSALSSSSTNPVQNKVVNSALAGKASSSHTHSNYASKSVYGDTSISVGRKSGTTVGTGSIAYGEDVTCNYDYSVGIGRGIIANSSQIVLGINNTDKNGPQNGSNYTGGSIFIVGDGYNKKNPDNSITVFKQNGLRLEDTKSMYGRTYYTSGADYAEYEEWADGNPNNEDRVGYFVTYDENSKKKIRKANAGEWILGIVSGHPCIVGNGDEEWLGRFIRDEFGRLILEESEFLSTEIDPDTGEKVEVVKIGKFPKENPSYDEEREYISRADRPEWDAVGWVGVLHVRDDGTCQPNGFCKCADGGIATSATVEDYSYLTPIYRVIDRVTDNVVRVVLNV